MSAARLATHHLHRPSKGQSELQAADVLSVADCANKSQSPLPPQQRPATPDCQHMLPASTPECFSQSSGQAVRKCLMYNELPISKKVKLIRDYESKSWSQRSLAHKYTVSRATVNQILKQKNKYLNEFAKIQSLAEGSAIGVRENANCMTLKRIRKTSISNVNHVLEQFVAESRINKWTLSGPKLKQKAKEVAQEMGLSDFKASNGWLDHFKKRCSLEFNSERLAAASGRRSNQENRDELFEQYMLDVNNNNSCQLDVSPFNLMDLHDDDADKQHQSPNLTSSSPNTSSSPHSPELNFTADTAVSMDLHFTDSISLTDGSQNVTQSSTSQLHDQLQVDGFSSNAGSSNDNCPNHSDWIMGFDANSASSTATTPSPDSNQQQQQQHSLPNYHLHHHHQHSTPHQIAVQFQAQHSHPEQTLADADLAANPHLDSLPHTLSLPSDQMIHLELAGHMQQPHDPALSQHHKQSSSPSSQVDNHSSSGLFVNSMNQQDVKHCRLLLTVNANSIANAASASDCALSSSPAKCHPVEHGSQVEVPAIADVRSAIDTLERFALTKMPPLLSSILSVRQEVGNFVIQQNQQQFQQQQQQHSQQNHLLNQ